MSARKLLLLRILLALGSAAATVLALLIVGLVYALLMYTLVGGIAGEWAHKEIARIPHPTAPIDALLVEAHGGATTGFGYDVHIVPRGTDFEDSDEAAWFYGHVSSRAPRGVHLEWTSPTELSVEFSAAESWKVIQPTVSVDGRRIHVRARPVEPPPPPVVEPPPQRPFPYR